MKRVRPLNEKKREAIIKAAIEEFHTKGYEGSSMDSVAKEASVSKATVYNHFKNKEELFFTIAYMLKERLEQSFSYLYKKDKDIKQQLLEIATQEMNFLNHEENLKLMQIAISVMIQKNEIGLKLIELAKDDMLIVLCKWFDEAKEDGKFIFESSEFISKQFMGMIKSFALYPQIYYGAPKLSEKEQSKVVDEAINMILKLYSK